MGGSARDSGIEPAHKEIDLILDTVASATASVKRFGGREYAVSKLPIGVGRELK